MVNHLDYLLVTLYLPESSKDEKEPTSEPEIKTAEGLDIDDKEDSGKEMESEDKNDSGKEMDSDDKKDSNNGKGAGSTVRKHSYTFYLAITVLSIVFYRRLSYC